MASSGASLPARVLATIEEFDLIKPGSRCLLAVSGGPDSTALCAAMIELATSGALPLALGAAHFDHGMRTASARDAEWVAAFAQRQGLAFIGERGDVPRLRKERHLSLEEAAREARMEFLERAAVDWGAGFVATGHTLDDQAETVLFRILRGTGLAGLAGIPLSRSISEASPDVRLVRPMLGVSRREVIEYLSSRGLDYLTDETNFDTAGQTRARIRHELLPALAAGFNPNVRDALVRLGGRAAEAEAVIRTAAVERLAGTLPGPGARPDELRLPVALLDCPQALRAEIFALAAEAVAGRQLAERGRLAAAARDLFTAGVGKRAELGDLLAVRDYGAVVISRRRPAERPEGSSGWVRSIKIPGRTQLPVGVLTARRVSRAKFDLKGFYKNKSPNEEVFDARLFAGKKQPWCRTRQPGDRFHPLGAAGPKKLKSFFIDSKLPRARRGRVPLLVLEGEILWAVGCRLSEEARVPEKARSLVKMEFVPADGQ